VCVLSGAFRHRSKGRWGVDRGCDIEANRPCFLLKDDLYFAGKDCIYFNRLPIGGLKEKIIAAHRGGIKKILIPKENEKDLKDVPKTISNQLEIVSVEHMDEVLTHALILDEGDSLFQKVDIPFEMTVENSEEPRRLV